MRHCVIPRPRLIWLALVGLVVVLIAGGCAPKYTDYSAFIDEPRPLVTATEYRVAPPDVLTFSSKLVREINGNTQQIRPDGKITLPLVGEIFVAGKTLTEITEEIEAIAQTYYEGADATVRITHFASKKVFVFGEVAVPGPYPYTGTNRVLDTLARAHPTRLADPSRITVLRPNSEGELIRRMTIDLDDMIKRGDLALDAVLEEGDIIFVPPNALASVGLALQQVLLPIQPAAATVQGPASIDANMTQMGVTGP